MERIQYGPLDLYELSLNVAVETCSNYHGKKDFRLLPSTVLLDFYEKLFEDRRLCILAKEFSDVDIFNRLLCTKQSKHFLVSCFQALLNHDEKLTKRLLQAFTYYTTKTDEKSDSDLIEIGMRIGSFLNDGGWYDYSSKFLDITEKLLLKSSDTNAKDVLLNLLECYRLKLYAEALYCQFSKASETYSAAQKLIERIKEQNEVSSLGGVYCGFSTYHLVQSNFDESYKWALKALELLPTCNSKRTILDILRQSSKACVVKRKFIQAGLLIRQAMSLAQMVQLQEELPIFSDILMDYGFFLFNSDAVGESVFVYANAVAHRFLIFDSNNIHIALAQEDLAYSLYVDEYNSGNFCRAKETAESAIQIMEKVLPKDHLLLASVKRVKALILEEIALDEGFDEQSQETFLSTAEELHNDALRLSLEYFGEKNVQTAKHYGNLGRLYQTMKQFEKAERMHLKSISIKEELLGPNDYEVGISAGHLASLYNYHMKKYEEAEKLYLRSIEINIRLFGPAYSGLEYDYRGLMNIYEKLVDPINSLFYHNKFWEWKDLRDEIEPLRHNEPLLAPKDVIKRFFDMEEDQKKLEEERALLAKEFSQCKVNIDESSI